MQHLLNHTYCLLCRDTVVYIGTDSQSKLPGGPLLRAIILFIILEFKQQKKANRNKRALHSALGSLKKTLAVPGSDNPIICILTSR